MKKISYIFFLFFLLLFVTCKSSDYYAWIFNPKSGIVYQNTTGEAFHNYQVKEGNIDVHLEYNGKNISIQAKIQNDLFDKRQLHFSFAKIIPLYPRKDEAGVPLPDTIDESTADYCKLQWDENEFHIRYNKEENRHFSLNSNGFVLTLSENLTFMIRDDLYRYGDLQVELKDGDDSYFFVLYRKGIDKTEV